MEKKLIIILVALCVICSTGSAFGAVYQWFGANGTGTPPPDRNWMNGENWRLEGTSTHGFVPTDQDRAKVNSVWNNPGPVIGGAFGTVSAVVGELFIAEGETGYQDVTVGVGGTLTTGSPGGVPWLGQMNIGYSPGLTGGLVADGGTANITQHLWLGWNGRGILQMNSGTVNVGQMFAPGAGTTFGGNPLNTGFGEVHLDGGLLHTQQWWGGAGFLGVHNYSFDITGGAWEIHGFWVNQIQELIDNGWITGGASVSWDPVNELTVVIPEPITLSLLGLGALLLRRRS